MPQPPVNPADSLSGVLLDSTWEVLGRLSPSPHSTGSTFSIGYQVRNAKSGDIAFLKALDLLGAMAKTSMALRDLLNAHAYEREVLERCFGARNVAVAIDHGEYRDPAAPHLPVPYLVFNMAEGDIRSRRVSTAYDVAFKLRCLHHVTVGMQQLHARRISHQDLKPSNVLVYADKVSRIGDLGRAIDGINGSIYDSFRFAGDRQYAPPEIMYHATMSPNWADQRLSADLYQLGSLIFYLFTDTQANAHLLLHLAPPHLPASWGDRYEDLLPHLVAGFGRSMEGFASALKRELDGYSTAQYRIRRIVEYLCHPDPLQRGHPVNRRGHQNPYGLERFVSEMDLLATAAEHKLLRGLRA